MAGRQKLDALETSSRTRNRRKSENMIDPSSIRAGRDHAGGEQSLDFRREQQPVILPCPEKRRDPEPVASELKLPATFVPQCDGELPAQSFPRSVAVILPQMGNDLRIAVSNEAMSARPQFIPALDVIKELAVKNHDDIAVFVKDRLLPIGQTDNAQPPRSQPEPGPNEKTLLVGAAVEQRPGHPFQTPLGNGTLSH